MKGEYGKSVRPKNLGNTGELYRQQKIWKALLVPRAEHAASEVTSK